MKKLILIYLSTGFILFFIQSCLPESNQTKAIPDKIPLEARTSDILDLIGVDCFKKIVGGNNCNNLLLTDTIVLTNVPTYPGCSFTVTYHYYICDLSAVGLTDISISDYQILEHNCQKFSDEIANNKGTNIWSSFIHTFDAKIHGEIQNYLINKFMIPDKYNCGSGALFTIKFFSSSCYMYCTSLSNFGKEGGNKYYITTKVSCGLQCCETHTRVCRLPNGSLQTIVTKAPIYPPYCQGGSLLTDTNSCIRGEDPWISDCIFDYDKCL